MTKLPLILSITDIVVSIIKGLETPILFGWDNIMMAMAIGVIGGLLGILLIEKFDEPLIGAVELIATGALIHVYRSFWRNINCTIHYSCNFSIIL